MGTIKRQDSFFTEKDFDKKEDSHWNFATS